MVVGRTLGSSSLFGFPRMDSRLVVLPSSGLRLCFSVHRRVERNLPLCLPRTFSLLPSLLAAIGPGWRSEICFPPFSPSYPTFVFCSGWRLHGCAEETQGIGGIFHWWNTYVLQLPTAQPSFEFYATYYLPATQLRFPSRQDPDGETSLFSYYDRTWDMVPLLESLPVLFDWRLLLQIGWRTLSTSFCLPTS